jgi:hypothetical protein
MGVNCCSHDKEPPEITINKPEKNITTQNPNLDKNQANNLVIINPNQNNQSSRSYISNIDSIIPWKGTMVMCHIFVNSEFI